MLVGQETWKVSFQASNIGPSHDYGIVISPWIVPELTRVARVIECSTVKTWLAPANTGGLSVLRAVKLDLPSVGAHRSTRSYRARLHEHTAEPS